MTELTTHTYVEQLHIPQHLAPRAYAEVSALVHHKCDGERTKHLIRYLANISKRTGQGWKVVERYETGGDAPYDLAYHRALLRAEDGSTLRVYYRQHSRCWVKAQSVLKSYEAAMRGAANG